MVPGIRLHQGLLCPVRFQGEMGLLCACTAGPTTGRAGGLRQSGPICDARHEGGEEWAFFVHMVKEVVNFWGETVTEAEYQGMMGALVPPAGLSSPRVQWAPLFGPRFLSPSVEVCVIGIPLQ